MRISDAIRVLEAYQSVHGDVEVVLWDLDTGDYFKLGEDHFESQRMSDGSERVSIGLNSYSDSRAKNPTTRLI
jgi:hypothetical protein